MNSRSIRINTSSSDSSNDSIIYKIDPSKSDSSYLEFPLTKGFYFILNKTFTKSNDDKLMSSNVYMNSDQANSKNYQNNFNNLLTFANFSNLSTGYDNNNNSNKNMSTSKMNQSTLPLNAEYSYLSEVEKTILRSNYPIEINETEEITVNGQKGLWINKNEIINWKGSLKLDQYPINEDQSPSLIRKRTQQKLEYIQELAVRYLKPVTPPIPSPIIINQESPIISEPAPPLVIRQQPLRPKTPEPFVIREAPPPPPPRVDRKIITISGKKLPPPPRKVIIERLPPLPAKPQSVIIERWLPYERLKRKVIFQRSYQKDPILIKPKNLIVEWDPPKVEIKKEYKYLGIIKANPAEYVKKYGTTLKLSSELPEIASSLEKPEGLSLASDIGYDGVYELEGDLEALQLIDLEKEGLGQYSKYLNNSNFEKQNPNSGSESNKLNTNLNQQQNGTKSELSNLKTPNSIEYYIDQVFEFLNTYNADKITVDDAKRIFFKYTSKLGKNLNDEDFDNLLNSSHLKDKELFEVSELKDLLLSINIS